ncbi:MAG: AsmA-like C-terminal domain-containing protein [Trichloromonas sp.]|jgi:hypothetical protein|nr:AsmA-like C-terminal domain-containing protein [Trichloromonas sp.]
MFRRHPTLAFYFLLLLFAAGAAAIFIATFDLDHYRRQLEETLAATLERPVTLGQARLSFDQGAALDFSRIDIGPAPNRPGSLTAAHLLVKPDLREALQGRLTFNEIVLSEPRLTLPPFGREKIDPAAILALFDQLRIHALSLRNGALLQEAPDRQGHPLLLLSGVDAALSGVKPGGTVELESSGRHWQGEESAPFGLRGNLTLGTDPRRWDDARVDLVLTLEHLQPQPLLAHFLPAEGNLSTSGALSLNGTVRGSLASGLELRLELGGEELRLHLPRLYETPLPVKRLHLAGTLARAEESWSFKTFTLRIDDLEVNGSLGLSVRDGESRLAASLKSSPLPLPGLRDLRPLREAWPAVERLTGGSLQILSLEIDGPMPGPGRMPAFLDALKARLRLKDLGARLDWPGDLSKLAADLNWRDGQLRVETGTARLKEEPLSFSGMVEKPWEGNFPLQLEAKTLLSATELLAKLTPRPVPGLTLFGPVPLRLNLAGVPEQLQIDLAADLTRVGAAYRGQAEKAMGQPATLSLQGEITPESLQLKAGQLHMPPLDLHLSGSLARQGQRPFTLELELAPLDLEQCRPRVPLLEKLRAEGLADLRYSLSGRHGKLEKHHGVAGVQRAGVHLTPVIADIREANGEILLYPNRAEARNLNLKLGGSPLVVDAKVADFRQPAVEIEVRGDSIRADDIIFPNNRAFLRRLNGHLRIDAKGILLDPVRVRLDGGTEATVRGTVTFAVPEVRLDIDAPYGNIDEIIALWQHPEDAPPEPPGAEKGKTRLLINATAHRGQLGNLHFQEARGEISLRDGMLTLFPLSFRSGEGRCQGHVAVDSSAGSPPLLKISGHLDNFDASAIYHEMLRRKGLVSGVLQGDFYLEGKSGKTFLESSTGGISFTVMDGVLRKFRILSKVFSIFNVSQILSLNLPDMDTEGMPFSLLRAGVRLDQGVLSTDDLFIDSTSMNLSLVGTLNLRNETLDMVLGVKPLRLVDQVVTNIPLAGWLLAGEEKALITAHFAITGKSDAPQVMVVPVTSVSEKVLGIFKRVFGLPGKVVSDVGELFKSSPNPVPEPQRD